MGKMQNLIVFYFMITYIATIFFTNSSLQVKKFEDVFWLAPFALWALCFGINLVTRNKFMLIWMKNTVGIQIYFCVLGAIMIVTNFFSIDVVYSLYSSIFSVGLLMVMFNVVGPAIMYFNNEPSYKHIISVSLITILIIGVIGNYIFPAFNFDSTPRISGGINPNMFALLALFSFVWFLNLRIDKLMPLYANIGIIVSLLVVISTMSRGRILALCLLIAYLVFFHYYTAFKERSKQEVIKKKSKKNIVWTSLIIVGLSITLFLVLNSEAITSRLLTSIDARINVWMLLIDYFNSNIFFGPLGWWNANDVIEQTNFGENTPAADSAHNLYLRILSEVGLIGFVAVMFLPGLVLFKSIQKIIGNNSMGSIQRKKLILFSGALVAFFTSQIFEDQYMNGIGDFQTGLFMWVIALNYYYLTSLPSREAYKEKTLQFRR